MPVVIILYNITCQKLTIHLIFQFVLENVSAEDFKTFSNPLYVTLGTLEIFFFIFFNFLIFMKFLKFRSLDGVDALFFVFITSLLLKKNINSFTFYHNFSNLNFSAFTYLKKIKLWIAQIKSQNQESIF